MSVLDLDDVQVGMLTRPQREQRVRDLIIDSHDLIDLAIRDLVGDRHELVAVCVLYSGGNDSTVLAHLMRGVATHAIHINTGIGIEQTRQFVRDVCRSWDLPLIEEGPEAHDSYRSIILDQGFPGPAHHYKMYQRLKERGLRKARNRLVKNPRRERTLFLAGRRRNESSRRAQVPEFERVGSTVWVSPLVRWTKLDMNTYRLMQGDVPVNEVTDLIHMSGECLCGAFAHVGELEELRPWFPQVVAEIEELEALLTATGRHDAERCRWGWGAYREDRVRASRSGRMCSTCAAGQDVLDHAHVEVAS